MIKVDMRLRPYNFIVEYVDIFEAMGEASGVLRGVCELASQVLGNDKTELLNIICSTVKKDWTKEGQSELHFIIKQKGEKANVS